MTELHVLSLGAGVQSTTMALMAAHGEITPMPDAAVFADTGAEPPAVYEHLEWLMGRNVLPFPVHIIQYSNIREDIERTAAGEKDVANRINGYLAPPFFTLNEDGSQGLLRRECTQNYKIRELEYAYKDLLKRPRDKAIRSRKPLVCSWIGISSDEAHRVKWLGPKWIRKRYPFLSRAIADDHQDLWLSRHDCITWLERHDYPVPPKSACTFCPYRSNAEWRNLRDTSPEGWAEAVHIDRLIRDMPDKERAGLRLGGKLYVHRDMVPLDEADIDDDTPRFDAWAGECEGMCGL